ncbi:phage holin family protein [Paenibacillus silviterrae]|uniref:phage holin family protein n=1 Tax=Paenibacillus silviterrae TaxID=3242194 RepID=UPI002542A71D|nr:phage holin family protein [Paenibacillus chinjuensis]
MERMDVILKAGTGIIGGVISWMVGGLGLALTILIGMMLFDFATGLMVAYVQKKISPRIGIQGLFKKTYVVILIGCVYMVEKSVPGVQLNGAIGDGVVVAYIIIEFLSILKNGGKLGVPLGPLKALQSAFEQKGVSK